MIPNEVMEILRCPDDRSKLSPARETVVRRVNAAIAAGRLVNRGGRVVERAIDAGLVRADGTILYPIVDQIPVLLRDDGILLDQFAE
jgi:uncharacterized protein YbaR (Trm112 family)